MARTKPVTTAEARTYLRKAEEFYLAMLDAVEKGRWNAAGLAGVHCAISATDAVLGVTVHVRSAGDDHRAAVDLLKKSVKGPDAEPQALRLSRVLGQKNRVEYDSREFREAEARDIVKDVGRYMDWARGKFPL